MRHPQHCFFPQFRCNMRKISAKRNRRAKLRSLKSSHKEALKKPLLCEDLSDLTSLTRNHIPVPDIDIGVSVVYDTF